MAKKKATSQTELIRMIHTHGQYFMPPGAQTSELHMAAFFHVARRAIVDELIYPEDGSEGLVCRRVGGRFLCRTDDVNDLLGETATSQTRPRKKGGNRRCQKPPCSKST